MDDILSIDNIDTADDEELLLLSQHIKYQKHLKRCNPEYIEWLNDNFQEGSN